MCPTDSGTVTKAEFNTNRDRDMNSRNVRKCKIVHCYENGTVFY